MQLTIDQVIEIIHEVSSRNLLVDKDLKKDQIELLRDLIIGRIIIEENELNQVLLDKNK